MTQNVSEIDVLFYKMTRNPKIYNKIFLVTALKVNNSGIENQQILKITNVEKHRNIRKWRTIEFFCEISEKWPRIYQYKSK